MRVITFHFFCFSFSSTVRRVQFGKLFTLSQKHDAKSCEHFFLKFPFYIFISNSHFLPIFGRSFFAFISSFFTRYLGFNFIKLLSMLSLKNSSDPPCTNDFYETYSKSWPRNAFWDLLKKFVRFKHFLIFITL